MSIEPTLRREGSSSDQSDRPDQVRRLWGDKHVSGLSPWISNFGELANACIGSHSTETNTAVGGPRSEGRTAQWPNSMDEPCAGLRQQSCPSVKTRTFTNLVESCCQRIGWPLYREHLLVGACPACRYPASPRKGTKLGRPSHSLGLIV